MEGVPKAHTVHTVGIQYNWLLQSVTSIFRCDRHHCISEYISDVVLGYSPYHGGSMEIAFRSTMGLLYSDHNVQYEQLEYCVL